MLRTVTPLALRAQAGLKPHQDGAVTPAHSRAGEIQRGDLLGPRFRGMSGVRRPKSN